MPDAIAVRLADLASLLARGSTRNAAGTDRARDRARPPRDRRDRVSPPPVNEIVLFGTETSGHTQRVAALLSILGLPWRLEKTPVEARRTPEFIAKNPFAQVPVLDDGDVRLTDSNAILVYLARRYDPSDRWLPRDPIGEARVQKWLSVAAGELAFGPARARAAKNFPRTG